MQIPEARWIVFGTLTLFTVMIALYVSSYFRNLAFGKTEDESTDLMTDFRQMRDEGHLGDEEYSKLKKVIPRTENITSSVGTQVRSKQTVANENEIEQDPEPEKKYLTLAEAQRLKNQSPSNQPEENDEAESNHEDEANSSE